VGYGEFCGEIELNVYKNKDEEEYQNTETFSLKMNILFNINVDFSSKPIHVS